MASVSLSACLLVACFAPNKAEVGGTTGDETSDESGGPGSTAPGSESDGSTSLASTGPTTSMSTDGEGSDGTSTEPTGPDSASESGETTGAAPGCGDGVVDEDEECDLGDDNGGADCTAVCTDVVCGDSIVSDGEACDDGDENGTELGDCAPDCSRQVVAKTISVSYNYSTYGDMGGPGAVDHVDARCESAGLPGYKAMFADGSNRRASVTPYVGDGQIDWVLTPWTRYLRDDGGLIWVTDESALLGVRDGAPEPILMPIATQFSTFAVTGLRGTWLTELNQDCSNWTTNSSGASQYRGIIDELTSDLFLAGNTPEFSPGNCSSSALVYCVEQ